MRKAKVVDMFFLGETDLKQISQKTGLTESDVIEMYKKWNQDKTKFDREEEVWE